MPPRLKTSTGCLTCRRRRKKCDEAKPHCGACTRLKLQCTWQPQISLSGRKDLIAYRSALPCYQTGQMVNGFPAFSSQAEYHFATTGPQLLSLLLSVAATPSWSDTSYLMPLVLTQLTVRSALVAFAAKIRSHEIKNRQVSLIAERAYHSTIIQTQQLLSGGIEDVNILPAIAVVICMGLFEGMGGGNYDVAAEHYSAALLLIGNHTARSQTLSTPSERQFFLVALEISLIFVAGAALFQPSLDLLARLDWQSIRMGIARNAPSLPSANHLPSLERHEYVEIFISLQQIASLARTHNSHQRRKTAQILWSTIENLGSGLQSSDSAVAGEELHNVYFHRWGLLLDTLRIWLLKIINPGVCSGHRLVKALVKSALSHLPPATVATGPWSIKWPAPFSNTSLALERQQSTFWWFYILICAIDEYELPEELRFVSDNPADMLAIEDRQRLLQLMAIIKKRKANDLRRCEAASGVCTVRHDGLDFLMHPRGICGILEDEAQSTV